MAVRNFWVDADIDGRETMLSGGPRAKDGGMSVIIKQRSKGDITTSLRILCTEHNGSLITQVYDVNHKLIFEKETER